VSAAVAAPADAANANANAASVAEVLLDLIWKTPLVGEKVRPRKPGPGQRRCTDCRTRSVPDARNEVSNLRALSTVTLCTACNAGNPLCYGAYLPSMRG
jgi:hypothetical protein